MTRQTTRWLVGALAAAIVVAVGLAWKHQPLLSDAPPVLTPSTVRSMPLSSSAAHAPVTMQVPSDVGQLAKLDTAEVHPLSVQTERLIAAHEPTAAFAAYVLVMSCAAFNHRHNDPVFDEKMRAWRQAHPQQREQDQKVCAGMTERQWQARLDYLAFAAQNGVPLAVLAFAQEGPFGDPSALKTRPDDPFVREWKTMAAAQLTQSAEEGELLTLMMWGLDRINGSDVAPKNPMQGYGYLLAVGLIDADLHGPDHPTARTYAADSSLMTALGANLTSEQRAAAAIAAQRIANDTTENVYHKMT
jgi:hypothetical protein